MKKIENVLYVISTLMYLVMLVAFAVNDDIKAGIVAIIFLLLANKYEKADE